MFFRFAKANCCNYSEKGPNGKVNYCWLKGQAATSILPWTLAASISSMWFSP
jgi:hypothetical protein